MIRADISSLVQSEKGLKLLWIHMCLLVWLTLSWITVILWVCRGTFRYRAFHIAALAAAPRSSPTSPTRADIPAPYYPHPHPQYPFQALPPSPGQDTEGPSRRGLRMRTVIVTNLPSQLRSERELKEYFQYYLSRKVEVPSVGVPLATTPPGFFNKLLAFGLNRGKRAAQHIHLPLPGVQRGRSAEETETEKGKGKGKAKAVGEGPAIDRVVVARKMTELANLLDRREDVLVRLETGHVKLARTVLEAVRLEMHARAKARSAKGDHRSSQIFLTRIRRHGSKEQDVMSENGEHEGEDRMDLLIRTLGPFVEEFGLEEPKSAKALLKSYKTAFGHRHHQSDSDVEPETPMDFKRESKTIWEALLSLPRSTLDAYQPLIHLSHLFRGKTVPAIDYYTAKLNLLNSLVLENRARRVENYEPVSTAFVTFKDPEDARRACKFLAAHPNNPLACLVRMAPCLEDLDWTRVMKSTYRTEVS